MWREMWMNWEDEEETFVYAPRQSIGVAFRKDQTVKEKKKKKKKKKRMVWRREEKNKQKQRLVSPL